MTNTPLPSRRELLRGSAVVAAGAWLQQGFAPPSTRSDSAVEPIDAGIEAATANGLALLVLIVPALEPGAAERRRQRARSWGALLLHGSEPLRARLSTCELACATEADLRARLARAPADLGDDSFAVLVEPGDGAATALNLAPEPAPETLRGHGEASTRNAKETVILEARLRRQSRQLQECLHPSVDEPAVIERRARANAAARGVALSAPNAPVDPELALSAPAVALHAAQHSLAKRGWQAALAARLGLRVGAVGPLGARWAHPGGCGAGPTVEGETPRSFGFGCGMAHTPTIAWRFLHFYTEPESNEK